MIGIVMNLSLALGTIVATSLSQPVINSVPPGGTLDMSAISTPQTITTTLKFSKAVTVTNCHVPITCATGKGGTCMAVQADNFSFVAQDKTCVITQPQQADQVVAFNLGAHANVTLKNFKLDWNEDNQDVSGYYYTPIASNFSGFNGGKTVLTNVTIDNIEVTRGGQRGIDLRGASNVLLTNSWFHQTGINVGGNIDPVHASKGNSVSIGMGADPNGPVILSQNTTCLNNLVEEHGDSFRCGDVNETLINNKIYGPAWFGHQPWGTSSGFDLTGVMGFTATGNSVYDVYGSLLIAIPLCYGMANPDSTCSKGTLVLSNNGVLSGNYYYSDSSMNAYGCRGNIGCGTVPMGSVTIGTSFYSIPENNIFLSNETFVGSVLNIDGVNNWGISGSSFDGYASTYFPTAIVISGAKTGNFSVGNVTVLNHDHKLQNGVFTNSTVNATPCTLGRNQIDSSISRPYYYYQNHDPGCSRQ